MAAGVSVRNLECSRIEKSASTWTGAQLDESMALVRLPIGPTNCQLVQPPTMVRVTVSVGRAAEVGPVGNWSRLRLRLRLIL